MKLGKLLGLALLMCSGCLSAPPTDNPLLARGTVENPVLIAPGPQTSDAYHKVFDRVYDAVDDYFQIAYSNRYDGRIISQPLIAPGIERFMKNGSTSIYERLYCSVQTVRYRCIVQIRVAEQGGYLVQVTVLRELADEPKPLNAPNSTVFRDSATVDRQFEVVDADLVIDPRWVPKGRETTIEDAILCSIRRSQDK